MENKEYEYDRYEVKLNRFMNVQKDYWFCLLGLVVCTLVAAISILVYKEEIQYLALLAVIYLIAVALKLCSNPRRLEITRTTVNFQYRYALLTLFVHGRIYAGGKNASKYTHTYTVYNIKSMEYLQTPFEKIFSCGHIYICGDVNTDGGGNEERAFTIYGVKHFSDISAWMKDFMILSDDEQI